MRYKSIELVNYAGIYNGMGLTQISIDFTQCISNKILIRGSNGSGKSTLMSAINPNPDSNDKFIPNTEARKTLVISDGVTDYVIRYIHPITNSGRGTTKGYISKTINGQLVELNPNGNISSCKDILYDEFGFDSGFISLAQLSSEDRGLVDKKPVERKKLVNNITSNLDTYNNIYKAVSKKVSLLKNLITNLTNKIDMIGDEVKVIAQLNNIEQRISSLEKDKDSTLEAIAAVKVKIADLQETLRNNKYDEILTELSGVNRLLKTSEQFINNALTNIKIQEGYSIEDFLHSIERSIIEIELDMDSINKNISSILIQRENEFKHLQDKQQQLNSLQSEYNYIDVRDAINSIQDTINQYEAIFSQAGLSHVDLLTKDEFDAGMEALKFLKDTANALVSKWSIELIRRDYENRSTILEEISKISYYKSQQEAARKLRDELQIKLNDAAADRRSASILSSRPKDCVIDTCPFIVNAINANNKTSESAYEKLSEDFNNALVNDVQLGNLLSDALDMKLVRDDVSAIERELKSKWKFIKKLPVRKDFIESFIPRIIAMDSFYDIDDLYRYIDCGNMIEEYKIAKEQLKVYQSEFNLYESKNIIIESIIKDVEELQNSTNSLATEIENLNNLLLVNQSKLEYFRELKTKVEQIITKKNEVYLPNKKRQEELTVLKQSLDIGAAEIQTLSQQVNQLNNNLGGINSDIKNLSDIRERLKHSLIMLNEYRIELDKYNKEYSVLEKVRYYSSPNTGIQSVFIGIYINKLLQTANKLLGLLFNGEFILQPFIVNESEFRIPCIGLDGLAHDDISSMSTAQKSAISMIISFALLHQSSTKYNIIACDEIDSGFDTTNRSGFVNLLDSLMRILNCEQAFIISHNTELDSSLCDIISLKNTTGDLINGHIIWKY